MLEEPYELIAHVRLCGEVDRVTGRLYPERDELDLARFSRLQNSQAQFVLFQGQFFIVARALAIR